MSGRDLLQRVVSDVFNGRDLAAVDELFTEDYVLHDPAAGDDIRGRDGFRRYVQNFHEAFPDLHVEQVDQLTDGDKIATRFVIRGTHDGALFGVAPTGRRIEVDGTIVSRIAGDAIAEEWTVVDVLGLMRQIGAIPGS